LIPDGEFRDARCRTILVFEALCGGLAQLVERKHGMFEVSGSTPLTSTEGFGDRNFQEVIMNRIRVVAVFIALFALAPLAQAKDLSNRLGIGYKNQFGADVPGVAVQYYPGSDLGLSAVLGIDTQQTQSRFGFMAKLNKIVFQEDNMNFYMGAGAGLLSQETAGRTDSGFELMGFGGSEFFLPGLENLGFSFEMGVAVTSLSNNVRFRTFGDSPIRAGMMFYF
jgi:hypothetical protein